MFGADQSAQAPIVPFTNNTFRAGAPQEEQILEISLRLRSQHAARWASSTVANFNMWANYILVRLERDSGTTIEEEIVKDPPTCYAHLFYPPGSDAECRVRSLQEGSAVLLQMVVMIKRRAQLELEQLIETCNIYEEMVRHLHDEMSQPDEVAQSLEIASGVVNQVDDCYAIQ